jgi:pimeloyl-ACP methyl ester carboxylesterase
VSGILRLKKSQKTRSMVEYESWIRSSRAGKQSPPIALPFFSEGQGPTLVMLGGGTTGAASLAPHAQELAKDFRVIRLRTLNIDRAQKAQPLPTGYSIKVESNAMARSLDQLCLTGPVNVVGHSLGALVALDFALDHPDRVRTLVLSEPPAFWVVPPDEFRASVEMT